MYKKILAILLVLTVSFTFVLVAPQQKAKANPILGVEAGVGVYCLAALAGAGALSLLGNDKGSQVLAEHAQKVWDSTNDAIKTAFTKTVSFVQGGLSDSMAIKYDLSKLTYEEDLEMRRLAKATSVSYFNDVSEDVYYQRAFDSTYSYKVDGLPVNMTSKFPFAPKFISNAGTVDLNLRAIPGYWISASNGGYTYVTKFLEVSYTGFGIWFGDSDRIDDVMELPTVSKMQALRIYTDIQNESDHFVGQESSYTVEILLDKLNHNGYGSWKFSVITDQAYQSMISGALTTTVDEYWETTKDAGLVIDADAIKATNPDLIFHPDSGTVTDATGADVPATSVFVPKPQIVTDSTGKDVIGIPVGETGVIKDALTGDEIKTGDSTGVDTGDGAGSDTGVLQGLWDWLKGILQSILDAIKALGQLVGLMALIDLIKSIIDSLKGIGLDIASILDYLNPLSEHFILTLAFVPTPTYFKDFFKEIYDKFKEKIPIFAQVFTFFGEIKNISYDNEIPSFLVHLPGDLGGKDLPIINFEFFTEYRPVVVNFIRFTAWFVFLKRLLRRLPKVVY